MSQVLAESERRKQSTHRVANQIADERLQKEAENTVTNPHTFMLKPATWYDLG